MKLVNINTDQPIIEFHGKQTIIHNKFLEDEMKMMGIAIPPGLRGVYNGKDAIFLYDESFQQAFKEIYYLTAMDPKVFHWV